MRIAGTMFFVFASQSTTRKIPAFVSLTWCHGNVVLKVTFLMSFWCYLPTPQLDAGSVSLKAAFHRLRYFSRNMSDSRAKQKWLAAKPHPCAALSKDANPDFCVKLIKCPSVSNYSGLKTKLQNSPNEWMVEFLEMGGMDALLQAMEALSLGRLLFVDTVLQLECVRCIKEILNSRAGLEFMVERCQLTRRLGEGWCC